MAFVSPTELAAVVETGEGEKGAAVVEPAAGEAVSGCSESVPLVAVSGCGGWVRLVVRCAFDGFSQGRAVRSSASRELPETEVGVTGESRAEGEDAGEARWHSQSVDVAGGDPVGEQP